MTASPMRAVAWLLALRVLFGLALALAAGHVIGQARTPAAPTAGPAPACPPSLVANGNDYHGLTLALCTFSGQDLTNANFAGATLRGVVFIKTNLTGADFSGATFADTGNATLPSDFTFANLTRAKFIGARFNGPTYLTHATLTCADFSSPASGTTDLGTGNAIFGDAPLTFDPTQCRPKFQRTTMNCEFVAQWKLLDLTGANIAACTGQLVTVNGQGFDFSGGLFGNVVFDRLDLTGSKWAGAVLEGASFQNATLDKATGLNGAPNAFSRLAGAKFNNASVQGVDLSYAQLYGAQFTNAELSNSKFDASLLTAPPSAPNTTAARFDGAHLKNVSFASARLQAATFLYASLYGGYGGAAPTFPCQTQCASLSGADLTRTDFSNAFLYGVDFRGATTTLDGTKFTGAILTGASFEGAKFQAESGAAPQFQGALLQGTIFDATANLAGATMFDAFVDFSTRGNNLFLLLGTRYTGFRGWSGASTPCVMLPYSKPSTVPSVASMTCPNGDAMVCGNGKTPASIAEWKSKIAMTNNQPPGWYANNATYDAKPAGIAEICGNGGNVEVKW